MEIWFVFEEWSIHFGSYQINGLCHMALLYRLTVTARGCYVNPFFIFNAFSVKLWKTRDPSWALLWSVTVMYCALWSSRFHISVNVSYGDNVFRAYMVGWLVGFESVNGQGKGLVLYFWPSLIITWEAFFCLHWSYQL